MIVTHKIKLDLAEGGTVPKIHVVQNDKYGHRIEISLYMEGQEWGVPSGVSAVIHYVKADGTGGSYDVLPDGSQGYSAEGNVLTVALAPQVCTVRGITQLSVCMMDGSVEINTVTILINVQPNPQEALHSEDYYRLSGVLPYSGWAANMYLGTDAYGNVVAQKGPDGSGPSASVAVPENVALLEDVTGNEAGGDFIPLRSPGGKEFRFSVGDGGIPVIRNASGMTVWTGSSGGTSGGDNGSDGGETGGEDTGGEDSGGNTGGTSGTWEHGVPYTFTPIEDEYFDNGTIKAYSGWARTDYLPCAGAARLNFSGNKYNTAYNGFFDINKTFLSSFQVAHSATDVEVPENAAFFMYSSNSESVNLCVITPYES